MNLNIDNFAKIKKAEIIIDGITVIAGENNTGKSTVGKILFTLFNSLSDLENKIMEERLSEVETLSNLILQDFIISADIPRNLYHRDIILISKRIKKNLGQLINENPILTNKDISECIKLSIKQIDLSSNLIIYDEYDETIDKLIEKTSEILSLPQNEVIIEVLTRYFNSVFNNQINSLLQKYDSTAVINLKIKGKENIIKFENNICKIFHENINIAHKAIYISNPFIIDNLRKYNNLNPMDNYLRELLTENAPINIFDGIIDSVRTKVKLNDIFESLYSIVQGRIVIGSDDNFYLESENFSEPIAFNNLSTGLKSFVIIKMLLEKGCLKEKDVLILDEPEIHLHPQWQITYAEIVVLLQKFFDLSIIVTTHSPYFLDAINLFSTKYGISDKANYYLSSINEENDINIKQVSNEINEIYKKMASPIEVLDTLRYELSNK